MWSLTQFENILWQKDLHYLLKVYWELLFESLLWHLSLYLWIPCLIEFSHNSTQFIFFQKVEKFKTTNLLIVSDSLPLPSSSLSEFNHKGQKENESHGQESDNDEAKNEQSKEKSSHGWILPEHKIASLLKEITDDLHPLQGEVDSLLWWFVLLKPILLSNTVLNFCLNQNFFLLLLFLTFCLLLLS